MNLGPHPFTLRQLQYAVAVADSLSFRKAADACHVSQPSLSAQLAQLETALGVRLFERNRRRVLITGAGSVIIERARIILRETEDLTMLARGASDPLSGTLHIGVIPTISPYLLPRLTPALHEAYPSLTILWSEDRTDTLIQRLDRGTLDAALLALEADIGDVDGAIIGSDAFVLATPPGHPLGSHPAPVKLSELNDVDVLLLDDGHCFREQALAVCSDAKAHELEFRATSLTTLVQMIASGVGVTLLPALAITTELNHAELSIRPFAQPAPTRTIAFVWRKCSPLGPALRKLAAATRPVFGVEATSSAPHDGPGNPKMAF